MVERLDRVAVEEPEQQQAAGPERPRELREGYGDPMRLVMDDREPRQDAAELVVLIVEVLDVADREREGCRVT